MTDEGKFGFEDDEGYPWNDVEAARKDRRLQQQHPLAETKGLLARALPCPKCQKPAAELAARASRA